MRRRTAQTPAYVQIPRGRHAQLKPIRYERWPEFWEDVLAELETIVAAWPATELRQVLFEFFVTAPDAVANAKQVVSEDRTCSPAQLAEQILAQFLLANARARGYLASRERANPSRASEAQSQDSRAP